MENLSPINVPPEQVHALYRYAQGKDQVNWQAQYIPNSPFLESLLPHMYEFLDKNIRKITYNPRKLRAVVGMSGGLDSVTTATLAAQTMSRAINHGTVDNTSLVLMTFQGMSREDYEIGCRFAEDLILKFPNVPITLHLQDLSPYLKLLDSDIDRTIKFTNQPKVYTGGLTTRFIALQLMEYADRTGHCALDTTNGTEVILGETVINGGGECAPLADLYKSQVYDLAEILEVPDYIINRPPINSTFGTDKVATYFREIPDDITPRAAYRVLDPILYYLFERKYQPSTVAKLLKHNPEFVHQIAIRINNQDHRRDTPYFVFNDRRKPTPRSNQNVSNLLMLKTLANSLAVRA